MDTICRIRIGADEIILWLRKNGKAEDVRNDDLGTKIRYLICDNLNGKKLKEGHPSYWPGEPGDHHIGEDELPKTAAQYEIDICRMCKLYKAINEW